MTFSRKTVSVQSMPYFNLSVQILLTTRLLRGHNVLQTSLVFIHLLVNMMSSPIANCAQTDQIMAADLGLYSLQCSSAPFRMTLAKLQ